MVESRFFGGLDVAETAQLLDVSEATVLRDWRAAKAWLARELRTGRRDGGSREMDAARWERVQTLFHDAADLPPADRRAFLETHAPTTRRSSPTCSRCSRRTRAATRCSTAASRRRGAIGARQVGEPDALRPSASGRIASRACSAKAAWASSTSPSATTSARVAAIKILRDAWLSPARRERFASEQRTLAQLNHPSIARLYDADTLADGTPWFVMEYVEGVPLTEYCRAHARLARRTAAPLPRRVRGGAARAPPRSSSTATSSRRTSSSTDDGTVKLLDFGIAKQLDGARRRRTDRTRTGLRLMTPAYAAPEQMRGGRLGMHTDVYSLGVILYELLVGPSALRPRDDIARPVEAALIAEHEAERPSVASRRARGGSRRPGGAAARAAEWADLDVLCLTAMHKDPRAPLCARSRR